MANEITYANTGDLKLAEVLSAELQLILSDRFSLWGHPSIFYAGDCSQSGSTTIKVGLAGLGSDAMSAVAEAATSSNTALTDSSVTIAVARQAIQRQVTDLSNLTDSIGLNVDALIRDGVGAALKRFQAMICVVGDDFTSTVGTSGADMTVDDWFSAQFTLTQASVEGPYLACLYPTQVTDLTNSIRGEAGAIQFKQDTQDLLGIKGQGVIGSFGGVDIVSSTQVVTANAGADSAGFMCGTHALAYADGTPSAIQGAGGVVYPAGQKIMVELSRDAGYSYTTVVSNYYVGVAILQDAKGVAIITDR